MSHASIPKEYWSYALATAVYLINRMPTHVLQLKSPFECLFGQAPNYSKLRIFGCLCFPWTRPYTTHKLDSRSIPCTFLGYSTTQSAYFCLDRTTSRIYTSRHVVFREYVFPCALPNTLISEAPAVDLDVETKNAGTTTVTAVPVQSSPPLATSSPPLQTTTPVVPATVPSTSSVPTASQPTSTPTAPETNVQRASTTDTGINLTPSSSDLQPEITNASQEHAPAIAQQPTRASTRRASQFKNLTSQQLFFHYQRRFLLP